MKKMMFNDRFGLTEAVIEKRKTVTRRELKMTRPRSLANCLKGMKYECMVDENDNQYEAPYYVGEIVAIAQSYKDCGEFDVYEAPKDTAGWKNKMFVRADLMPHQIRILDVRAERLQDITEEDCLSEGVRECPYDYGYTNGVYRMCRIDGVLEHVMTVHKSLRKAFAELIDKISGKGTWNANPFVWRIEFELINNKGNYYYIEENSKSEGFLVDPDTVGQFTGLLDKNGKEIYEGDIIYENKINTYWKVRYDVSLAEYRAENIADECDDVELNAIYLDDSEIISNIHDNPYFCQKKMRYKQAQKIK